MKIGVISDTHNYLDPKVPELLEGADHILHAGDVGLPAILHQLERIAPVTAVLGNTDDPAFGYRLTEVVQLEGVCFLVHHIVDPDSLSDELQGRIDRAKPRVVVFGHTHKPFEGIRDQVLFLNPGYAGKQRFDLPRSLAILELKDHGVQARLLSL